MQCLDVLKQIASDDRDTEHQSRAPSHSSQIQVTHTHTHTHRDPEQVVFYMQINLTKELINRIFAPKTIFCPFSFIFHKKGKIYKILNNGVLLCSSAKTECNPSVLLITSINCSTSRRFYTCSALTRHVSLSTHLYSQYISGRYLMCHRGGTWGK